MSVREHLVGKPQYHLLPWDALEEVAKVLAMGAEKYGERAWEEGIPYSESISALMRHQKLFFQDRKDYDVESGLLHTAHMACNILFLVAGQLRGTADIDDRPGSTPPMPESRPDVPKSRPDVPKGMTEFLVSNVEGNRKVLRVKGDVESVYPLIEAGCKDLASWPFKEQPAEDGIYVVMTMVYPQGSCCPGVCFGCFGAEHWWLTTQTDITDFEHLGVSIKELFRNQYRTSKAEPANPELMASIHDVEKF